MGLERNGRVLCFFAGDPTDESNHQPHNAAAAQPHVRLVEQSKSIALRAPTLIAKLQLRFEHRYLHAPRQIGANTFRNCTRPGLSAYRGERLRIAGELFRAISRDPAHSDLLVMCFSKCLNNSLAPFLGFALHLCASGRSIPD